MGFYDFEHFNSETIFHQYWARLNTYVILY